MDNSDTLVIVFNIRDLFTLCQFPQLRVSNIYIRNRADVMTICATLYTAEMCSIFTTEIIISTRSYTVWRSRQI